jgi:ceramide glucosyltransferase
MLFRRNDLRRLGGFGSLVPYLADDYRLGKGISRMGLDLVVSTHPVEITLADDGWREVWRRQLRWSKTIRACRPLGHFGLLFTQGSIWGLLCLVSTTICGCSPRVALFPTAVLTLRLAAALLVGWWCLGSKAVAGGLPLMFLADGLSWAAWLGSFFTRRVYWGGRLLRISPDGRILNKPSPPEVERSPGFSQ